MHIFTKSLEFLGQSLSKEDLNAFLKRSSNISRLKLNFPKYLPVFERRIYFKNGLCFFFHYASIQNSKHSGEANLNGYKNYYSIVLFSISSPFIVA